jgi:hypothetical protein
MSVEIEAAKPGSYSLTVSSAAGTDTLQNALTVTPAHLKVTPVNPTRVHQGEGTDVTIKFKDFKAGAGVSFGDDIKVKNIAYDEKGKDKGMVVSIHVDSKAAVGERDVILFPVDHPPASFHFTVEKAVGSKGTPP